VITTAPALTPVITPVEEPILAVVVALLLQVPPVDVVDKVMVDPTQTLEAPVMAAGRLFTVIAVVARQPVPSV
jgi:hypothetical protein